jgi:hypothetical protein
MTMHSTNPTPSAEPIDYAPAPRNRRWIYRVIFASLLLGLALVFWKEGPTWWRRTGILYWQHQCLQFSLSPDTVVYEEDPTEAAALLAGNPKYHPYPVQRRSSQQAAPSSATAAALGVSGWNNLASVLPRSYSPLTNPAVIFLHERISPAGHCRLVCVRYGPQRDTFNAEFYQGFNCDTFTVTPGTWTQPPTYTPQGWMVDILTGWPRKPPLVRIFAGQPDPNDPAHFTIRYRMWGQDDVLDGRLLDNDQVALTPRKEPSENN